MRILEGRNVNKIFPLALSMLRQVGEVRNSRNGLVVQATCPVTTVYYRPTERVLFSSDRDANPFFHLYESLWMIAGRRDVAPLVKFAKQMSAYSDDGDTLNAAYGFRWRNHFSQDQLNVIIRRLRAFPEDRRCVLQMWDTDLDLDNPSKDVPCNMIATFQRDSEGKLNLVVFCRSNDIIWGCYGANVVHFSFLQEYMAHAIGCEVGTYTQVSVNWHAYLDVLRKTEITKYEIDPYISHTNPVHSLSFGEDTCEVDDLIKQLLYVEGKDFQIPYEFPKGTIFEVAQTMFLAHFVYRTSNLNYRFQNAREILNQLDSNIDWIRAGHEWINRREAKWLAKQA